MDFPMIYIGTTLPACSFGGIFSHYHAFTVLLYFSQNMGSGNEIGRVIAMLAVDNPERRPHSMRIAVAILIPQEDNAFSDSVREIAQGLALLKQHIPYSSSN